MGEEHSVELSLWLLASFPAGQVDGRWLARDGGGVECVDTDVNDAGTKPFVYTMVDGCVVQGEVYFGFQ